MRAVDQLLGALRTQEATAGIRSSSNILDVYTELQAITGKIAKSFNYEYFRPLIRLIIEDAPNNKIWEAVLDLIAKLSSLTPPTSIAASFDGTPVIRSSSSFKGNEQTKRHLDIALQYEVKGRVYRGVEGFFEKYFQSRPWQERYEQIYASMSAQYVDGKWLGYPFPATQEEVWKWLSGLQNQFLQGLDREYKTTSSKKDLIGGEAPRQLDIFLKSRTSAGLKHDWKDVLVVGEHKQTPHAINDLLLQVSRYVREVFAAQPTRRFVPAFFLHGSKMELWVFDRSGPYSSGEFDIHERPDKFASAFIGYALMSDEELGLDTFIGGTTESPTVTISKDSRGRKRKLQLEPSPFVKQRAVVCRGTTCYRTLDRKKVVKLSWTSDKRRPEAELLNSARKSGVQGIARFLGYQGISSISELRDGLTFGSPWVFRGQCAVESTTSTHSYLSNSMRMLHFSNMGGSSRPDLPEDRVTVDRKLTNKRKRTDDHVAPAKRPKLAEGGSRAPGKSPDGASTSLYEPNSEKFDNRLFGCLAIAPAGQPLIDCGSIRELIRAMRDAIKAHKSLYFKGKILHRDISENNLIFTNPKENKGFTGMLIDMDLAKLIGTGPSGARHQTGTMEFMAIEVLRRVAHTFRHDLESFFYVLLWICGRRVWEQGARWTSDKRPKRDVFRKWYQGSFDDIAEAKQGHMHADGFEAVLAQFPSEFACIKPLCSQMRQILFPLQKDGKLDIGTPCSAETLYQSVLEEFDSAIVTLTS